MQVRLFVCVCVVCLFVFVCVLLLSRRGKYLFPRSHWNFPQFFVFCFIFRTRNLLNSVRIKLEFCITGLQEMFDSNQGQKFATKSENLFGFSQWNLQESIDSRRTILYDKLKYLPAIYLDSLNFVNENLERMDSGILVKLVTLILVLCLFVCLFICFFFSVNKSSIRESSLIYTILCNCSYKSWKEWILGFAVHWSNFYPWFYKSRWFGMMYNLAGMIYSLKVKFLTSTPSVRHLKLGTWIMWE